MSSCVALKDSTTSDWRKPDGQFVIRPEEVDAFLEPLPVKKIPGVGKVMETRLQELGIGTVAELRGWPAEALVDRFGRYGQRLWELARGIDDHPVTPDRPTQSISAEDTFATDVTLAETEETIRRLAEKVWAAAQRETRKARTVVLKLKTTQFRILTRSHTGVLPPASCEELTDQALTLRERVEDKGSRFRLVGVGLSNFHDPPIRIQGGLFGP